MSAVKSSEVTVCQPPISVAESIRDCVDRMGDKIGAAKPGSTRRAIYRYVTNLSSNLQGAARVNSPFANSKPLESRAAGNVTKVLDLRDSVRKVAQNLVAELDRIGKAKPEAEELAVKERGVILDALEGLCNGNPGDCLEPMIDILSAVEKIFGKTNATGGVSTLKELHIELKKHVKEARNTLANLVDKAAKACSKVAAFLRKPIFLEREVTLEEKDLETSLPIPAQKNVKTQHSETPDASASTASTNSGSDFLNSEQEVQGTGTSNTDTASSDSDSAKKKDVTLVAKNTDEFLRKRQAMAEMQRPRAPSIGAAVSNFWQKRDTILPKVGSIPPYITGRLFSTLTENRLKTQRPKTSISGAIDPNSDYEYYDSDDHPEHKTGAA
jgi:hypothetical protein